MEKTTTPRRVAVIGGGAAGLLAAGTAAEQGASVFILEKNPSPGKKLLITGKGRCNVTNDCAVADFFNNVPRNPRFLYSAVNAFSPADTMAFFENLGCPLKTERGQRVFPVSDRAADILHALEVYVKRNHVRILHETATAIRYTERDGTKTVAGVETDGGFHPADAVIIATGGKSYPVTGSTGDGYRLAKEAGHTVTEIAPSLVPLVMRDTCCAEMQGLSMKNTALSVRNEKTGKIIYRDFGEMLFTHFGVSGPMILSASAHMDRETVAHCTLSLDLKPALDEKALDRRLLNDFQSGINKNFGNVLGGLLPQKMIPVLIRLSGISPEKKVHDITKEERETLIRLLKGFPLRCAGFRPIAEAIVTSGGVSVKEINPKTMESRCASGLYFAGEVIDVDAYTGGFNLQIAFSTGRAAGIAAGE